MTIIDIIREVAAKYGITPDEMLSVSSARRFARPRQEAMWLCRQVRNRDGQPRYSLPLIGQRFRRHHTTVLYAVEVYERRAMKTEQAA